MLKKLFVLLQETLVPTLLVAMLSGIIAVTCLSLILFPLGFLQVISRRSTYFNMAPIGELRWSDLYEILSIPVIGLIGSFALWKTTLSFGLVSALAQHWGGPSRRVSIAVGAMYGGVWAALCFTGQAVHDSGGIRVSWLMEQVAMSVALGAAVGLFIPWRYLIRSWWKVAKA